MLAAAWLGASQASANGIHPNARDVYAGAVGPYFLRVTTAPIVGNMHFVVFLAQSDEIQPVEAAEITLWGRSTGEEVRTAGPVAGVPSLDGPNLYTVDVSVDEIGPWLFTVSVSGPLGEGSADIPLTVARSGSVNLGVVGILLVVVVLVGLMALSWGRKRRRRRGSGARK
jgi:hypothetical protein